jgi:hypothetical protein
MYFIPLSSATSLSMRPNYKQILVHLFFFSSHLSPVADEIIKIKGAKRLNSSNNDSSLLPEGIGQVAIVVGLRSIPGSITAILGFL